MKTSRLYIMILISTGIHLGALGFWSQIGQPIHITTDLRGQTFNVALTKPQPHKPELKPSVKTSTVRSYSSSKQTALISDTKIPKSQTKPKKTTLHPPPIKPEQPVTITEINKPLMQNSALLNNDMIRELSSEFQARFKYPMLARKRGWQGKVLLALNINLQGKITNIAIKRSSGYKVLDRNAVKTFEAIGMISPSLHEHIQKAHSFNIPVVYQLNGG